MLYLLHLYGTKSICQNVIEMCFPQTLVTKVKMLILSSFLVIEKGLLQVDI